ncbi:hypothetical protein SDC9_187220 [bioreactor metagenome]|uniref:Uncharacterized protein n=1 Tax=bioreactor metagenome TaxID=1076179 RepID=A0A645HL24_9ZZZZ
MELLELVRRRAEILRDPDILGRRDVDNVGFGNDERNERDGSRGIAERSG